VPRAKHLYGDDKVLKWPPFNPQQKLFISSKEPFVCGSGGYGSGKTTALVFRGIVLSTDSPYFGDMTGNVGLLGRCKEKDLVKTTLVELFKWLPRSWVRKYYKNEGVIELINGSVIHVTHLDSVDHLQSLNLGWCGIDQMEQVQRDIFDAISLERIRLTTLNRRDENDVFATLDYQTVFGVCNPRRCWVFDLFVKNEEYRNSTEPLVRELWKPNYRLIEIPTLENVDNLPPEYINRQREIKSDREYNRDVLGRWDTFSGQVYEDYDDKLVLTGNRIPKPEWSLYVGLDHGGSGTPDKQFATNVTGVVFIAYEERQNDWPLIHVFDELFLPSKTIEEVVGEIDERLQGIAAVQKIKYPTNPFVELIGVRVVPALWRCDPNMAKQRDKDGDQESIIDGYMRHAMLRGFNMPLSPGGSNFMERHTKINWMFRTGIVDFNPKCVHTIDSIKNLEYGINGKPKNHQNDHNANALEYCLTGVPLWWAKLEKPERKESAMAQYIRAHREGLLDDNTADPILGNRRLRNFVEGEVHHAF